MSLPEPAIIWLVRNASSNLELACLSNVCRGWREIVIKTLLQQAKDSLVAVESSPSSSPSMGKSSSDRYNQLLLLPSMVRFLLSDKKLTDNNIETYCLAWFHPLGIEIKQLSIDAMDDSDDEDAIMFARDHRGDESPQPFAPSGEQSYAGSEEEAKQSRRHRSPGALVSAVGAGLRSLGSSGKHVNCMYQWNGYREAKEVLSPFGYAPDFIQRVLVEARAASDEMQLDRSSAPGVNHTTSKNSIFREYSTFAVRGSIVARPEGYCLCWDQDLAKIESQIREESSSLSNNNNNNNNNPSETKLNVRRQEYNQLLRRRNRRRRELQREVLPRVLYSAPGNNQQSDGDIQLGIQQPCVQFLNVDSSHAVRLFTPPFKPGPVPSPITIFCVAIATEDGCFLSGLKHRFELGHMYPETQRDDLIERSPICICTEVGEAPVSSGEHEKNDQQKQSGYPKDESFNSDDSSCDMSLEATGGDPGLKCVCPFSGLGNEVDYEEDNPTAQICRGKRGPGVWHCYVAVFDGYASTIRMDGVPEPVHCTRPKVPPLVAATLDGLTIGADHTFDMSLCFGQGSDGEGEGAMSELAVFKGRLDVPDIERIEHYLMSKHGIPLPTMSENDLVEENQYYRLAHAMLSHAPNHSVFATGIKRVPLRYMTKHRIVAWRQTNPVTGEAIKVQRIGSKFGESSSDW